MEQNKNNIAEIQQLLNNFISKTDSIQRLLVCIRIELEFSCEDKKLDTLKFYCDWPLHAKIDRSSAGSKLISRLHEILNRYKSDDTNLLIHEIQKTLLKNFKDQLTTFFNARHIKTSIINNEQQWNIFLNSLFGLLMQTPVHLKSVDENGLKNNPLKDGMWVNKISLIQSNLGNAINHEMYCLEINTSDTTRIIVPLINKI